MRQTSPSWESVYGAFRRIWGYSELRSPQAEVIQSLLAQQDSLTILPTGGGKSICFQLPALLQTGLTLVVSPLVALMENQVQELHQRHPSFTRSVALLHSERPQGERKRTLLALEHQQLRLLYLSPETLFSPAVWERLCQPALSINGLILDEAHCLVQWGETFRPAYMRLGAVRPALLAHQPAGSRIAIAAFTATADPKAQTTIQQVLQLNQPEVFRVNPYRANLELRVQTVWTPRQRRQKLLHLIQAHPRESGLVYVRTRQDSEQLATWLCQQGYRTAAYHAGLSPIQRRQLETDWQSNRLQFVVCTSAFGMGINKPDVRWVAHFHAPLLLSEYVQEVGRAGRDGKPAIALTLISEPTGLLDPEDRQRQQFFMGKIRQQQQQAEQLARKLPPQGSVAAVSRQFKDGATALALLHTAGWLDWTDPFHYVLRYPSKATAMGDSHRQAAQAMQAYLSSKTCRWQFLLQAFGFGEAAINFRCGHCDRCQKRVT